MLKQCFKIVDGRLTACPREEGQVHVYVKPDEAEQRHLIDTLRLDEHTLMSSLDPDELARLDREPDVEHARVAAGVTEAHPVEADRRPAVHRHAPATGASRAGRPGGLIRPLRGPTAASCRAPTAPP